MSLCLFSGRWQLKPLAHGRRGMDGHAGAWKKRRPLGNDVRSRWNFSFTLNRVHFDGRFWQSCPANGFFRQPCTHCWLNIGFCELLCDIQLHLRTPNTQIMHVISLQQHQDKIQKVYYQWYNNSVPNTLVPSPLCLQDGEKQLNHRVHQ